MSVHRTLHINDWWNLPGVKKHAEDLAMELGVQRAKYYSPVDTGKLKKSIRRENRNTFGSTVRYAYYQETGDTYTRFTPFLKPAMADIIKALPDIYRKAIRRMK